MNSKNKGVMDMFKHSKLMLFVALSILVFLLTACNANSNNAISADEVKNVDTDKIEAIEPHKGLNQEPVPLKVERDGKDVYVEMTAQITDIEIQPGTMYKAWTFNGEAPRSEERR